MKKILRQISLAQQLFGISGSFGRVEGEYTYENNACKVENSQYSACANFVISKSGVITRRDYITNKSDSKITLNQATAKFRLEGGMYEVYTQFNGWCTESLGGWQPLISSVTASVSALRTSHDASPMMAIWNKHTHRGYVFHLLPNSAWEITAKKCDLGGKCYNLEVSLGLSGGFSIPLAPGETFSLPEIWFYEFKNKTDLDCYKLHEYCMQRFETPKMPVIYNTWLSHFDHLSVESVTEQIEKAARLGVEYFVIDAGWFGNLPRWHSCVGDWEERKIDRLEGRMHEIANKVRENGMKFGLWFEIERADIDSEIIKKYPEFFDKEGYAYFIDFGIPEAVDYLNNVLDDIIEKNGIEFIKFDFNSDLTHDKENSAFVNYYKNYNLFISNLRKRHPNIHFENCASGGMRMNLTNCNDFDDFWYTDNQSVYHSLRIYKDSILRMPPQFLANYATFRTADGFQDYDGGTCSKIIATESAEWKNVRGVTLSFLKALLTGGAPCFSCDLTQVEDSVLDELAIFIDKYKAQREFWQKSTCRILCDSEELTVYQYTSIETGEIKLYAIAHYCHQRDICIYPVVDNTKDYITSEGEVLTAAELLENGIILPIEDIYTMREFELKVK